LSTQQTDPTGASGGPSEEELRAAYEAELSRITTTDMLAQTAVSLLNLGARKLQPAPAAGAAGADLEQARDAIDGARALLEILERRIPQELRPLRDALSQLQMAYAREMQGAAAQPPGEADAKAQGAAPTPTPSEQPDTPKTGQESDASQQEPGPGPAEASGRLWVPGR
jgi:hypothetical protein